MANSQQGFISLLTSQTGECRSPGFVSLSSSHTVELDSPELPPFSSQTSTTSTVRERRKWSVQEELILISSWLNTSKDPIVGNEQKCGTFWKRIHEYYNSSVILAGFESRDIGQCKQKWGKLNDLVCKFCGCYDAALRDQSSGENDNDVLKKALEIFANDYNCKFTLEHAWRELRHDQKWCSIYQGKEGGKEKRKTVSEAVEGQEELPGDRPPGVKAAKAARKKKGGPEEAFTEMQKVLEMKSILNKQKLLEKLLEKTELAEMEVALKLKLMSEML